VVNARDVPLSKQLENITLNHSLNVSQDGGIFELNASSSQVIKGVTSADSSQLLVASGAPMR
jgi:hypothetical protein